MRARRVAAWIVAALALLLVLVWAAPRIALWRLGPVARERAVALLEERFDGVELERLELSLAPGLLLPRLAARGGGLKLSLPDRTDVPPFLAIHELELEVSLLGVFRRPVRVEELRLDELVIQIPPGRDGDDTSENERPPPVVVVDRLVADGTVLRILPGDPEKTPLQFDLYELTVRAAGVSEPMRFDALLRNAKPPGDIETTGSFGPLDLEDAGASPVSGRYVFENANLSVFGGIAGTLSSEGTFGGTLGRIRVQGFTETPEFQLTSAGNPVRLRTEFEATVDGTSGDTLLHPVEAVLGESRFRAEGGVVQEPGGDGKTVCLSAENARGRIEDFLRLAMKQEPPVMEGEIEFAALIVIPPGDVDVTKKLALDGEFSIGSATFPEREIQKRVEDLSRVGRGAEALREERVFSDIRGRFRLADGVMTLSTLSFTVPGAQVNLLGSYGLVTEELDFRGELRLDAKLSETTSGIKSFLLKAIDPLFGRDDAGAVIPIKITGSPDEPSYGVEIGRVFSREEVAAPPEGAVAERIWPAPGASCRALELAETAKREE